MSQPVDYSSYHTAPSTAVQLHLGVDGTATHFKLEQQAVNEAAFRVPDQKGWQPQQQCIDDHPGLTLSSRLATSLDVAALAGKWLACRLLHQAQ
jgi:pyroglutamyl-peptidase